MPDSLESAYRQLIESMLNVAEVCEDAWRLGRLDNYLKPWIRDDLLGRGANLSWCDNAIDVELVFTGVAAQGHRYAELRRQLFSDLNHSGPEPVWRKVGSPFSDDFAIRALSRIHQDQPTYLLRRGPRNWELIISSLDGDQTHLIVVRHDTEHPGTIDVSAPGLRNNPAAYEQLGHGFRCLGYQPHLAR
ncbi:hypothetical protein [Nocardia sp. NPDC048505]|uniref:hypothetical protein n=1 Tax=unclassified Nocardia TaxID=2637762 RepID=UPI0033F49A1E